MRIKIFVKKYLMIILFTLFVILNGHICFADDIDVEQLINSMVEKFDTVADYTCRLDKRVRKNGILYEDLAIYVKYKKPKQEVSRR